MPAYGPSLPADFSWLSPTCRPSPQEVETYAHIINAVEEHSPEQFDSCLREAELQIWIWRNEEALARRPKRARRSKLPHPTPALPDLAPGPRRRGSAFPDRVLHS